MISRRLLTLAFFILVLAGPSPKVGAEPISQVGVENLSPRLSEVTVTSPAMEKNMKMRVLLPAGYAASAKRYPVLYLLHGVGDDQTVWTTLTDIEAFTAAFEVIVVMPDGGKNEKAGWYSDWYNGGGFGAPRYETHHIAELIPFVDSVYRTIADRSGRLAAGHSMGGFGAMSYAARHPDLFVAAASFSGAVDTMIAEPGSGLVFQSAQFRGTPSDAVWGNQTLQEVRWRTHNPVDLALNLGGLGLSAASGDGTPAIGDNPAEGPGLEAGIRLMNDSLHSALNAAGVTHYYDPYSPGTHAWKYAQRNLHDALPRLLAAVGTPAPATFHYRSAEPSFSVYGWDFETKRTVMEFIEITGAGRDGLTIKGSDKVAVTTPPLFNPGEVVDVSSNSPVSADAAGRLSFEADLGPSHQFQEFTAESDSQKASQGASYWRVLGVRFTRSPIPSTTTGGIAATGSGLSVVGAAALLAGGCLALCLLRLRY